MKQITMLKNQNKSYGGDLLKTRKGRSYGRPLDTNNSMHLVLRSSRAVGAFSFNKKQNSAKVIQIIDRFSKKNGIQIVSFANVGNHLHLQIKLSRRHGYRPFIRAVTSSIAMAITGASRWRPMRTKATPNCRFWDYRPFTRVVYGYKAFLRLRDYIQLNRLEGFGLARPQARFFLKWQNLKHATDFG